MTKQLRAIIWAAVSSDAQAKDEKSSLPEQERAARAFADESGWRIIDVLTVPGHSRRYVDFHELNRDALAEGIDAFQRLLQHWESCDFDVLIVRDGTRFARTQTLHAYVTERTIIAGARIYSFADGWIDQANYRMFTAMSGYSAAAQVDQISKSQKIAKDKLASRGVWHNGRPPWFLTVVRNDYGKAQSQHINRDHQRLYDDLAEIILAGVSWLHIERDLWTRGHGKNGKPWPRYAMYHAMHNPYWWGHSASGYNPASLKRHNPGDQSVDLWCFDDTFLVPDRVNIWRNTHDAVWTGDQAQLIQDEMRRRRLSLRGSAKSATTHRFTGLLICGYCGRSIVFRNHRHGKNWSCQSKYAARQGPRCEKVRSISERKLTPQINALLEQMLSEDDPTMLARPDDTPQPDHTARIAAEVATVEGQIRRLILKQADAPDNLTSLYDEQIASLGQQLDTLQTQLAAHQQRSQVHALATAKSAFRELSDFETIELFWSRSDREINQHLHRLLGNRRLVIQHGKITGTADAR